MKYNVRLYLLEEEIKKSICKQKKIFRKSYIDLESFVLIDLEKDIGKHIDKKHQFQTQKKVKLLSRRFTQLENSLVQLCNPIQVYDILGEIIGKKYDFRCNQAINTSGMLIDELIPYDFTRTLNSSVQEGRNSLSSYSEPKTPGTGTSGYNSITPPNDNESIALHDEFEDEQNFSTTENDSSANELHSVEEENMTNNNHEDLFTNNSTFKQAERNELEEECTQQTKVQNVSDQNCLIQNSKDMNEIKNGYQNRNSLQANQIKESNRNNDKTIVELRVSNKIKDNKQIDCISEENQIFQLNESCNIKWKKGLPSMQKRGNQTTRVSICSVDDINEFEWKPMPLVQGIKHVFSNNSSILKLPDYISFSERKFDSKKRKFTSKFCKPKCLAKFVLHETELFAKKDTLHTKQKFRHLQKDEIEDFMKNFDECLNGIERENNSQYEAVTNIALDLLGFRICQNQNDSIENNIEDITNCIRSSSPIDVPLQSTNCQNSLDTFVTSPNSYNNWCESSTSEINLSYSLPDYQTLIEDKMKEIFEESNITTELDQIVGKWHTSLQPKLLEAEARPPFRIHDYSCRIIKALQALEQKKMNFNNVVQDKPACEVARYFLASLQLANTYNVEIKAGNSDDIIEITLLDNEKDSCAKLKE
ncbi:uncharacterized protein LOC122529299 isoform X3 [Frieseomelitta varia]|uniref:uncharacterized protein LOC122529299 isoform X3 n=1 Tax=Frieseomelitta varia TaxID=561572 RepID=UPI001CB69034|nr:uncharacterized protein LOC122529299 isoform X3 [Frieseomelitta varia]